MKECPHHGTWSEASYCPICGFNMTEQPQCKCGKPVAHWETYCRYCGAKR